MPAPLEGIFNCTVFPVSDPILYDLQLSIHPSFIYTAYFCLVNKFMLIIVRSIDVSVRVLLLVQCIFVCVKHVAG